MDELGIPAFEGEESETLFYPLHDKFKASLIYNKNKLRCMEPSDVILYGDYDSDIANLLRISIETCKNTTENGNHCKSPELITEWLKDKYILLYYNQIKFNTTAYHEESLSHRSYLRWVKTSST